MRVSDAKMMIRVHDRLQPELLLVQDCRCR